MPAKVRPSVCPLDCPDRCSLEVTTDGASILKIDGSHRSPFTRGYICAKVRSFDERVDSPFRIQTPLRRVSNKGSGEFEPFSWDEAIAMIADRFQSIVKTAGGAAILPYSYSGSNGLLTSHAMDERFFNKLGATRLARTLCAANTGAAWSSVMDDVPGSDPAGVEDTDCAVLWGVNPSASGIHLVPLVRNAKKRGAKLIVIDPRRTPLARDAHHHLAVKPGTDVVLALSMIHVAITHSWHDAAFLQEHTRGLDALARAAAKFPPAVAAGICGVAADSIVEATRSISAARAPFFRVGWGQERNRNGTDATRAVFMLRVLFGKFNEKGAGLAMSTSRGYAMRFEEAEGAHLRTAAARTLNMSEFGRILDETTDPPILGLFIYNCNPVATAPNQARIERAMQRENLFTVVHEQVFTDTCRLADVVLPATTFLEHRELSRSYGGFALQWADPVIEARGEAIQNHALFTRLAKAMNFTEREFTDSEEAIARSILTSMAVKAPDLETLQKENYVPVAPGRPLHTVFPTRGFVDLGTTAPPRFLANPCETDGSFTLISPATDKAITSTLYETLAPGTGRMAVNPEDATTLGLTDGAAARVENRFGTVEIRVQVTGEVPPGVVSIPKGYWKSATLNGFTSNALSPDHVDAVGGGACYNDARVSIRPLPA